MAGPPTLATQASALDQRSRDVLAALGKDAAVEADALSEVVLAVVERARGDLPHDVAIHPSEFARHLASCVAGAEHVLPALAALHAADLALAFACAQGDSAALAWFRRRFTPDVERIVGKYSALADERDDVVQNLFARLLVPRRAAPPRIAEYRGAGPLQGWLRIATVRLAINLAKARARERQLFDVGAPASGPATASKPVTNAEDHLVQRWYTDVVRQAIEAAFGSLTTRERNLLRHQLIGGLTIDEIAPIYQVHRATVARWLERAREQLAKSTRDRLVTHHGIADPDIDSIMRCIKSELELSLARLLEA